MMYDEYYGCRGGTSGSKGKLIQYLEFQGGLSTGRVYKSIYILSVSQLIW